MKTQICLTCGATFEWSPQFYQAKGLQIPPLRCPTCADQAQHKDPHHVALERECLLEFACCDVSQALSILPFADIGTDGHHTQPYRRAIIKGSQHGKSWSGRIDVFDQRSIPVNTLARVRIMRTRHQAGATLTGVKVEGPCFPWYSKSTYQYQAPDTWEYVVLDDTQGNTPTCRLILVSAIQKWNRDDSISGNPLWSTTAHGSSRSGRHSGQTVLAVVDKDHPLTAKMVHDKGALNQADRIVLARGDWASTMVMLARKADKPVEVQETVFDGQEAQ